MLLSQRASTRRADRRRRTPRTRSSRWRRRPRPAPAAADRTPAARWRTPLRRDGRPPCSGDVEAHRAQRHAPVVVARHRGAARRAVGTSGADCADGRRRAKASTAQRGNRGGKNGKRTPSSYPNGRDRCRQVLWRDVSMTAHSRAWFQIHVCVVLWGFTAILGRLITLPRAAARVVAHAPRHAGAGAVAAVLGRICGRMPRRLIAIYVGIGVARDAALDHVLRLDQAVERLGGGHVHGADAGVRVDHRAVAGAPAARTWRKWA